MGFFFRTTVVLATLVAAATDTHFASESESNLSRLDSLHFNPSTMKKALISAAIFCIQYVWANTEKLILQVNSRELTSCDPHFGALSKTREAASLKPPFSEIQNSIIPGRNFQWYSLDDVKDNANYEIRISYPAIASIPNHAFHSCY